ncbi:MAG TPA: hypothetical protein VE134_10150, partial [Methanomicrobiales archaeon]|nr:hypothetical protein [Methanomicrobiales archaeon]
RGGTAEVLEDGSIGVQWNQTRFFEIRFYDPSREMLLMAFGTIWVSAIVMFTVPYLLTRRGKRRE